MNKIYQLAVPKGRRICCEVCEAPAERVCPACTVTYYCDVVHQKTDWNSIHEKICQLLIPLRTIMPFYNSEEERQHGLQQLQQRQIYFASCAFGTEDIRTSGGYFHLATIFFDLMKLDLADTLYTKVCEIWDKYLNNRYQVLSEARIQQIDLLGRRFETDTGLDEAQEAEAIRILTSILNIRESTSSRTPQKITFVLRILVMLYYLMMNSSKAQEYATRAFNLAQEKQLGAQEQNLIELLLNIISTEDTNPIL